MERSNTGNSHSKPFIGAMVLWVSSVLYLIGSTYWFHQNSFRICPLKQWSGIPCAGCGATRSVLAFFQMDLLSSLYLNPLGFAWGIMLLLLPLLWVIDLLFSKSSLRNFLLWSIELIYKKEVLLILLFLLLLNWGWNIQKGL